MYRLNNPLNLMGVRRSVRDEIDRRSVGVVYNPDGTVAGDPTTGRNLVVPPAFEEHPKQKVFAEAVFSGSYKFLLFGGAIRGGKTFVALAIVFVLCKVFPGSRWAVVRKSYSALRRNTVPAFNKLRPTNFIGGINYSTWTAKCNNGSEILFMPESFKEDPDLNRFRGLEVNGFLPEEMNELEEMTFYKMVERAGTWIVPPIRQREVRPDGTSILVERRQAQPPSLIIGTCNPANNWVKGLFYDPYVKGTLDRPYFYLPASPYDNPHLPDGYIETLEKVLPESEQKKFLRGDWSTVADPDQLILSEWILAARDVEPEPGKNVLGVDVGRFGNDPSVFCLVNGNEVKFFERYEKMRISRLGQILRIRCMNIPVSADNVRVDAVGLGAGLVDDCSSNNFNVVEVIAGAKPYVHPEEVRRTKWATGGRPNIGLRSPTRSKEDAAFAESYRFYDLRSQMWWMAARRLEDGEICLPEDIPPKLIEDLTSIKYEIRSDRTIKVESKDDIYKRIGRSTDDGDAFVMAVFELPIVAPVREATQGTMSGRRLLR